MLALLTRFARLAAQRSDVVVASFVLLAILMMVVPLPTYLVDILVCINIAMGLLILVVAFYTAHSVDFSSLPPIILLSTLFRLALSITTTRLILRDADAGDIVATFGEFVIAGDVVIGLVVFLVITIGQFVVITKGAERVAEVAARFSLDAMPGKQMSIDTDLRNGDIDQGEARVRRSRLERESQLFGAMDGAMKFVKGDAIACLIILFINLIGGLLIGMLRHGMPFGEAVHTYSMLTVGDGLIAQIPALLTAVAAGTVVTRVASEEHRDLGAEIVGQLGANPRALGLTAAMLTVLSVIPGFPAEVFLLIALVPGSAAFVLWRRARRTADADSEAAAPPSLDGTASFDMDAADDQAFDDRYHMHRIALSISPELGDVWSLEALRSAVGAARAEVATTLGIAMPSVAVCIDEHIDGQGYRIDLEGIPVFEDRVPAHSVRVIEDAAQVALAGVPVTLGSPLTRMQPTLWAAQTDIAALEQAHLAFESSEAAVGRYLQMTLQAHAPEFVGIQETRTLLTDMEGGYPELVKEVLRSHSVHRVSEVLRRLLDEGIGLRNLRAVLEALAEWGPRDLELHVLSERVRSSLARQICHAHADAYRVIPAYALAKPLEDAIRKTLRSAAAGRSQTLPEAVSHRLRDTLRELYAAVIGDPAPVVITAPDIRRYLRQWLVRHDLPLTVMSYADLSREYTTQAVSVITLGDDDTDETMPAERDRERDTRSPRTSPALAGT